LHFDYKFYDFNFTTVLLWTVEQTLKGFGDQMNIFSKVCKFKSVLSPHVKTIKIFPVLFKSKLQIGFSQQQGSRKIKNHQRTNTKY